MTLKKGCRTDYSLIFGDINAFFDRFYVTFGMPLCCLELKFSYLRTCKSHSIVNTCWHKFHVRSHLVHAQQVIILRAAVDFFYQEAKAQNSPIKSASRSRYLPTRYNSQVQGSTNPFHPFYPQPRIWRLHTLRCSAIHDPI